MTAVRLRAGGYTATFRPDAGMLGTSLRFRGEEYVARPEPLARNREGAMTAIALMHPWANRLRTRRYRAAGRTVSLVGIDLPTDDNGLPLHGTLGAAPFVVESVDPARLVAFRLHASDDERFAAFPFPHRLTVEARLDARSGLAISTTVEPTGGRPVPVAFGWHPHLRLPGSGRAAWRLDLPPCERLALDDRNLPTGERTPEPGRGVPLAGTTLDDHFALRDPCAVTIGDGTRRITLRCGPGYGFLQVYAPARRRFVAIEPMTAAIDGLGLGAVPIVDAGTAYTATFTLRVGTD